MQISVKINEPAKPNNTLTFNQIKKINGIYKYSNYENYYLIVKNSQFYCVTTNSFIQAQKSNCTHYRFVKMPADFELVITFKA